MALPFRQLILVFIGLFLNGVSAHGHPGVGLVRDSHGTIFYTDLLHVWQIAPNGRKSIAVRHVHTHELMLDAQDNLYGENLQYEGEAINRWHHQIWKRSPSGQLTDLFGTRPGFRLDYGFVRDRQGTLYWLEQDKPSAIIFKRTSNGVISSITPKLSFERLNWLAVSPDGQHLYVTSSNGLYEVSLSGEVEPLFTYPTRHTTMGIWPGQDGSVFVADYGEHLIKKVLPTGKVITVAQTQSPWSPSSMLMAPDGALWVLEYSTDNSARVRRIAQNGTERIY